MTKLTGADKRRYTSLTSPLCVKTNNRDIVFLVSVLMRGYIILIPADNLSRRQAKISGIIIGTFTSLGTQADPHLFL